MFALALLLCLVLVPDWQEGREDVDSWQTCGPVTAMRVGTAPGEEVIGRWDKDVNARPMTEQHRRRQRRIEADRCYDGARTALERRPPQVEQAKFLFESARVAYADLGVFDMIEPLKWLERNIHRLDRAEPVQSYEAYQRDARLASAAAESSSPTKVGKYLRLDGEYLNEDTRRCGEADGHDEGDDDEPDEWVTMMPNVRALSHQPRKSEALFKTSQPYRLNLEDRIQHTPAWQSPYLDTAEVQPPVVVRQTAGIPATATGLVAGETTREGGHGDLGGDRRVALKSHEPLSQQADAWERSVSSLGVSSSIWLSFVCWSRFA